MEGGLPGSEKIPELLRRKARIPDNAAHGERVHGVVPWNGHNPPSVGHDDVPALPGDMEAGLFQGLDRPKVRDPWYLRHALRRDLHFPQILLTGQLPGDFEVFANGILNIRQSLLFSGPLRPAPRQSGARDAVTLFGPYQSNWIPHTSDCSMWCARKKSVGVFRLWRAGFNPREASASLFHRLG